MKEGISPLLSISLLVFLFISFFGFQSEAQSIEKEIIGEWKFSYLEIKDKQYGTSRFTEYHIEEIRFFDNREVHVFLNSTSDSTTIEKIIGKWTLLNNNRTLLLCDFKTNQGEKSQIKDSQFSIKFKGKNSLILLSKVGSKNGNSITYPKKENCKIYYKKISKKF